MRHEMMLLACGLTVGIVAGLGYYAQFEMAEAINEVDRTPPATVVAQPPQPAPAAQSPTRVAVSPAAKPVASDPPAAPRQAATTVAQQEPAAAKALAPVNPARAEEVQAALWRLGSSHWKDRRDAMVLLETFGSDAAAAATRLAELLADQAVPPPPPGTRWFKAPPPNSQFAMGALVAIGEAACTPVAQVLRTSQDPVTRCNALTVLGQLMPSNIVELCAPLVDNPSHEVRIIAINLLGKSANPHAAPALRNCLKTLSLPNDRARALEALCNVLNKDALPDLVAAIDDRDPEVRQFAENRLQFSIDGNSIGFLVQLLDNAATTKRLMAAGALSRLAFSERFVVRQATPALMIRVATDPEYEVRRQALDALTKLNDPRAGVLFLALLDQNDESLRRSALIGLTNLAIEGVLDPATALEPVTRVVHASRDTRSRSQALETLYRLGSSEAWQVINEMADDADPKVQQKLKNLRYFIQNRSRTRSR